MSIILTQRAIDEVKAAISKEPQGAGGAAAPAPILRIGVVGGGCSGLTYRMGFDEAVREDDHVEEIEGIKVAVDPRSHLYLDGTEVDYQDGLLGRGFVFRNPNARGGCHCGQSFSA